MQIPKRTWCRHDGAPPREENDGDEDTSYHRTNAEKDRDKLVHCSHLRRLAGVTQVVGAQEGHVFHNRLTHTQKVAQLAERLAQRLNAIHDDLPEHIGTIDPDVVEAAALAHDLGHPPFGHVAEQELARLVDKAMIESSACDYVEEPTEEGEVAPDGFEGNAQSFRIVTRLGGHKPDRPGLDLSRATLNAILKYPWRRSAPDVDDPWHDFYGVDPDKKYGAYHSDPLDFEWTRKGIDDSARSVEAEIMDHADALAYSVHDLDDFVRAGMVPIGHLLARKPGGGTGEDGLGDSQPADEFRAFMEWFVDFAKSDQLDEALIWRNEDHLWRLVDFVYGAGVFRGAFEERADLHRKNSVLIERFMKAASLQADEPERPTLKVEPKRLLEMRFLQGLVRYYVIEDRRLATQQHGQRQVINNLFEVYLDAVQQGDEELIPGRFSVELAEADEGDGNGNPSADQIRLAADIVSSFTDYQALHMHRRLTGSDVGSVTEVVPA